MLTSILQIWSPDGGDQYALTQDLAAIVQDVEDNIINPPYVRLKNTNDVTYTSTQHAFQIGPTSGENLAMDTNEIMVRDGGAPATFGLNINGGDIWLGDGTSNIRLWGRVNSNHYPWAVSAGSYTFNPVAAGAVVTQTVPFPAGRFTQTPAITLGLSSTQPQLRGVGWSNASATGFDLTYSNVGGSSVATPRVHWQAIQMTSSSGSG
jgi:hypothetical protein